MMEETRSRHPPTTPSASAASATKPPVDLRGKDHPHPLRTKPPGFTKSRPRPKRIPVYYNGTRTGEAKALDRLANDRAPRTPATFPKIITLTFQEPQTRNQESVTTTNQS